MSSNDLPLTSRVFPLTTIFDQLCFILFAASAHLAKAFDIEEVSELILIDVSYSPIKS